jgi:cystathionine beta-lyase/cystathionine gamma-synthase
MQIKPGIETLAVHAGHPLDKGTDAVTPAIHLSTTFARLSDGSYQHTYDYIRFIRSYKQKRKRKSENADHNQKKDASNQKVASNAGSDSSNHNSASTTRLCKLERLSISRHQCQGLLSVQHKYI